ncbi:MAG TPA: HAD-IIA family hydrolase [Actinomycetota bacterium]|nr:HAD-IIA family hydrolase [Actinomycetota bacterium]
MSPSPADRFDAFLLDLDGVLYRGGDPVEGAPEAVDALRSRSKAVVFVTNNSWRTPAQVAAKLEGMGIHAPPEEVVTSGQATAAQLRRDLGANGATAYVLGGEGVRSALADAGIDSADGEPDRVDVVVVGWDRDLTYDRLRTATVLIGRGAGLVATNADPSYPAPGGELWPGAGAILAAVEAGSGRRATVVGKPQRPLFDLAVDRAGSRAALVVGDRIETDIVGAANAGLDSALVLTGASTPADLLVADALPTMVVANLRELTDERTEPSIVRAGSSHQGAVRALLDEMGLTAEPGWDRDAETVVALLDGDVVATSAADVQAEDAYLRSVAVREGLRGTGLGMLMVATVVRNIRRRGAKRLWLVTETAAPFFERLGFAPVERAALPRWIADRSDHCPGSAVTMRRDLAQ